MLPVEFRAAMRATIDIRNHLAIEADRKTGHDTILARHVEAHAPSTFDQRGGFAHYAFVISHCSSSPTELTIASGARAAN